MAKMKQIEEATKRVIDTAASAPVRSGFATPSMTRWRHVTKEVLRRRDDVRLDGEELHFENGAVIVPIILNKQANPTIH